ncbi:MAG: SRPBCC domain-containing protein [Sphingomonadales bacterium]|nr:SRPBCC domain-containing protein [Sphingomonadales bacterium]MDE2171440.1 SRPBCC domain-containing protein [Sphingomonadales bacterium]
MDLTDTNSTATTTRRTGRELVVTRLVKGPPRLVFKAWAEPELFRQWWVPASCGLTIISLDAEIRTGGTYRLVMGHPASDRPMTFFGRYIEVVPDARIVWTNDEGDEEGPVTTVTFEARGEDTLLVVHELYPSEEALDEAIASGSTSGWSEQFEQLEAFVQAF